MHKAFLIGLLSLTAACQSGPLSPSPVPTGTLTPSAPATPRKPFTLTPAVTSTPVPLYFTEEFNTDLGAWHYFQTGGEGDPTVALEDGSLRFSIPSPNTWYYAIHNSHDYEDVFVRAEFGGAPSGSLGLVCRYSKNGWYEFNLASDGTYSVLFAQWLTDDIAQYTPITSHSSEYLRPGILAYEIGLTCLENSLLLHINGKLFRKLDVTRYGLTAGRIGLATSSFDETPMTASVEWLSVSAPDE